MIFLMAQASGQEDRADVARRESSMPQASLWEGNSGISGTHEPQPLIHFPLRLPPTPTVDAEALKVGGAGITPAEGTPEQEAKEASACPQAKHKSAFNDKAYSQMLYGFSW